MAEPGQLEQRAPAMQAEATFKEAVGLMCGPDSGALIARWIPMIEQASDAGHAPATELRSVFEVMGVARPQSWDRAFDLLVRAAEQGSVSAKRQLLILARSDIADGQASANDDSAFWERTRADISISQLLSHPERVSLSDAPRIRVIGRFAHRAECAWMIDRARSRLSRAKVIDLSGQQNVDGGRSNSGAEFLVQDMDVVMEVIRTRISSATKIPIPVFEPTQILHYDVGEEFRPHFDFLDPSNAGYRKNLESGQRIATFLIFLNDDFEGGETQFPDVRINYRGRTGDAIFWANVDMQGRPDPLTRHAGLPPTAGEKWILSQWIRDRTAPTR
jgi:prolyl 4-hydroxylase